MEVFYKNLPYSVSESEFTLEIASILHGPDFEQFSRPGHLLNFEVQRFTGGRKRKSSRHNSRFGTITLPAQAIGDRFLFLFGGARPLRQLRLQNVRISFEASNRGRRPGFEGRVQFLQSHPYVQPTALINRDQQEKQLDDNLSVTSVQFGWPCRDGTFSIEWDQDGPFQVCPNPLILSALTFLFSYRSTFLVAKSE